MFVSCFWLVSGCWVFLVCWGVGGCCCFVWWWVGWFFVMAGGCHGPGVSLSWFRVSPLVVWVGMWLDVWLAYPLTQVMHQGVEWHVYKAPGTRKTYIVWTGNKIIRDKATNKQQRATSPWLFLVFVGGGVVVVVVAGWVWLGVA